MNLPLLDSPEAVEAAFYQAFRAADIRLMMSLWTNSDDTLCIHPGSAALAGYSAIQQGWAYIFAGGPIQIESTLLHRQQADQLAWHGIEERLTQAEGGRITSLFVSHLYVKTTQGWKLSLHHASAAPPAVPLSGKLH